MSPSDDKLRADLKTLVRFVTFYCDRRHGDTVKAVVCLRGIDVSSLATRPVALCPQCSKLLAHALVKRIRCPLDPKPACRNCPQHCYGPPYRAAIRKVMRFAGPRARIAPSCQRSGPGGCRGPASSEDKTLGLARRALDPYQYMRPFMSFILRP